MSPDTARTPTDDRRWVGPVARIAAASVVLRLLFHGLLFRFELAGDEAHYWDWARNLQLSYHTKGPAVAWLIRLGTELLGHNEVGVRVFTWLSGAVATMAAGWLGAMLAPKEPRKVALLAALLFQAVAAYQVTASVMTIDMPMIAGWMVASAATVDLHRRANAGRPVTTPCVVIGASLAFAFLAKYTAVLAGLGLLLGLWFDRRTLANAHGLRRGALLGFLAFAIGPGCVLLWNAQHDWATVRHLLGHLSMEADGSNTSTFTGYQPMWTIEYFGIVFTACGPFVAIAMWLGVRWARHQDNAAMVRLCLWGALPVLVFYAFVSLRTRVEGNWAIGAYGPLVAPTALWLRRQQLDGRWRWLRRAIAIRGIATMAVILFAIPMLQGVARLGAALGQDWDNALHRVVGHRRFADEIRTRVRAATGKNAEDLPILVNYYDRVGLLGFYLPGHPIVRCASRLLGGRPSAYDDFASTRLPDDTLLGRQVVLVGADEARWRGALELDDLQALGIVLQRGRKRQLFVARLKAFKTP
ncbi:MAG TPA: phospholipid carrier-dependent glycosyltransferase [bacterium]|nr:phospholipid carrier-dependent glycosyltransferase [bacterium]